jgi:hypothetical protein
MVEADVVRIVFQAMLEQRVGDDNNDGGAHVSTSAENVRLYSCICLQRLSRSPFPLFADQAPEQARTRLQLLLHWLRHVASFNIRAILLNVLLQAVSPLPPAVAQQAGGFCLRPEVDLELPLAGEDEQLLRKVREECGSIGSAHSSRRPSPALDALAGPARHVPPMPLPASSVSASSGTPAAQAESNAAATTAAAASERRPSYSAAAQSAPSTRPSSAAPAATRAAADLDEEDEEDQVSPLSGDMEQRVDKTAQLHALIDAILDKSAAAAEAAESGAPAAGL